MQDLRLSEFNPEPALVTETHMPERPRWPVLDMHNHTQWATQWHYDDIGALVDSMDNAGVAAYVDLDGGTGARLARHIERLREPYPDRFIVYTRLNWQWAVEESRDFGTLLAQQVRDSVAAGAEGLKVWKDVGLRIRDLNGKRLTVSDERLDPLWETVGELGIPVTIHIADPLAFFKPADTRNERIEELSNHPDWHFYGPEFPSFKQVLEEFETMLDRHPKVTFIGAHLASSAENLRYLSNMLDSHSNLMIDISERIGELGRQPYSARDFLMKYSERVLFGLDISPARAIDYRIYYRFLETQDEYFPYGDPSKDGPGRQGRWRIYGINLPDDVLARIYYQNALKVIPRLQRSVDAMAAKLNG
ncbi:amidohydrolase family protein [Alicyclobacillus curvatus]|nr:amidohydrolase family protein [Alicyclobacillus curvatus]